MSEYRLVHCSGRVNCYQICLVSVGADSSIKEIGEPLMVCPTFDELLEDMAKFSDALRKPQVEVAIG